MAGVVYMLYFAGVSAWYIGGTWDCLARWKAHRSFLRSGHHHCKALQAAFDEHGEGRLRFGIVEWLPGALGDTLAVAERAAMERVIARHGRVALLNTSLKPRPTQYARRRPSSVLPGNEVSPSPGVGRG